VSNAIAKEPQRLEQDRRPARPSKEPPRKRKGRLTGPRRKRRSYVHPVTGKPHLSAEASAQKSAGKKEGVLTRDRLREVRRMAKRQKPLALTFQQEVVAPNGLAAGSAAMDHASAKSERRSARPWEAALIEGHSELTP
jgi:hypothetical protein